MTSHYLNTTFIYRHIYNNWVSSHPNYIWNLGHGNQIPPVLLRLLVAWCNAGLGLIFLQIPNLHIQDRPNTDYLKRKPGITPPSVELGWPCWWCSCSSLSTQLCAARGGGACRNPAAPFAWQTPPTPLCYRHVSSAAEKLLAGPQWCAISKYVWNYWSRGSAYRAVINEAAVIQVRH